MFSTAKILVIGDAMLDRYLYSDDFRFSVENHSPIVTVTSREDRLGGAANVAHNLCQLGVNTSLACAIGRDKAGKALSKLLLEQPLTLHAVEVAGTTLKSRIVHKHQQLLRLDADYRVTNGQFAALKSQLGVNYDLVVLSDYAKGMLQDAPSYLQWGNTQGLRVLVDPKSTDFKQYAGAFLLTPNWHEFTAVVGPCATDTLIVERARNLLFSHQIQHLVVTRGELGMTWVSQEDHRHIAAVTKDVADVTGAGDTVVAVLAAGLSIGQSVRAAAITANRAAGLVVSKFGTATLSKSEFIKYCWG